ncbi:MAG: ABC transporter permease [Oscillospiraceae bacterium]|nr:ABC transporter permease [Oscillospiraceae bacterium]
MRKHEVKYLFREGVRGAFLHPFISFAAVTIIAACLVVMGSFTLVAHNIDRFIVTLGQVDEIAVMMDYGMSEEDARHIHAGINRIDNIRTNEFTSASEHLEQWRIDFPALAAGLQEGDNPFQHRAIVTLMDIELQEDTVAQIMAIEGVEDVRNDAQIRETLSAMHNVANVVSWALIFLLGTVSVLIVSNTIKLATYERREEIAIMRVVGATRRFIRVPFFIEGALLGITGGLLAFALQALTYNALVGRATFDWMDFSAVAFSEVNTEVFGAFVLGGLLAGSLGSVVTIRRFLKT